MPGGFLGPTLNQAARFSFPLSPCSRSLTQSNKTHCLPPYAGPSGPPAHSTTHTIHPVPPSSNSPKPGSGPWLPPPNPPRNPNQSPNPVISLSRQLRNSLPCHNCPLARPLSPPSGHHSSFGNCLLTPQQHDSLRYKSAFLADLLDGALWWSG